MHEPAIYQIHVQGRLDASLSDQIWGMQISEIRGADGAQETIMVGRLVDQAALCGILNSLNQLHLPLIAVECLDIEV